MTVINYKAVKNLGLKNSKDMALFLSDLIKIKSLDSQEKDVVIRIKEEMEKVGFDEISIDSMGNIIGKIGSGKTIVAFDAHIDTVDTGDEDAWDIPSFSGLIRNENVYGRGSTDQKGGMVSIIYAVKIMKELNFLKDLTIYVTGTVNEEECEGMCWDYILSKGEIKPSFVVITEPSNLTICRGHRGRMAIRVRTTGLSAHGSAPERGDNAIYKMAPIISDIERLNERLKYDSFLGKATITLSQIFFTSASSCAVPDECNIMLDRRLTKGESKESVLREINELESIRISNASVEVCKYDEPCYTGLIYPTESYFPVWVTEAEHKVVKTAVKAYSNLFNEEPKVNKWTFDTNAVSIAGKHGIPCIGFGPGDETRAHAPNEFVEICHLEKATMMYSIIPVLYLDKMNGN